MTTTSAPSTSTPAAAWLGIDVAKDTFDAAVMSAETASLPVRNIPVSTFDRSPEGVAHMLAWIDTLLPAGTSARAVLETTGRYGVELALWMLEARPTLAPAIVNARAAYHFANSLGLREKSDRTDARSLARYGVDRAPTPWQPPHPLHDELRELSRFRETLVQDRVDANNRLKENSSSKTVLRLLQKQIDRFSADIKRIEREMDKIFAKLPALKTDLERMQTIDGVGKQTARVIVAELGDLRRFESGRKLSAFVGVCPSRKQSGSNLIGRTRMSKIGSPRVRKALYMAALATIRQDNQIAAMYRSMVRAGKAKKSALGAVMRKLLLTMRAVLVHDQPYNPWPTTTCA